MFSIVQDVFEASLMLALIIYANARKFILDILMLFAPFGFFDIALFSLLVSLGLLGVVFFMVRWFVSMWDTRGHDPHRVHDLETGMYQPFGNTVVRPTTFPNSEHLAVKTSSEDTYLVMIPVFVEEEDLELEEEEECVSPCIGNSYRD
ncbi:hypothetical protein VKT23_012547 [Stygiomarasmius scandens]|uniref:Transmembrane protein n=1 Tax=Marasmiellus scandens TaxID=2682957 RepID=A0ABR1J836_9AGAR